LKLKRERKQFGSVVLDKRRNVWMFLWREDGARRSKAIGTLQEFRSKSAARAAAKPLRDALEAGQKLTQNSNSVLVKNLVEKYRQERMPKRYSTRRSYDVWLNHRILPRWSAEPITNVQPREVEMWLSTLELAPKSKAELRSLLGRLWDFAMWCGYVPIQRNPMQLVRIPGSSKRTREPRSLTIEEFQLFVSKLHDPFRTMALISVSFGLRISECLGLKWEDIDWLNGKLHVQRGIVRQRIGEVKTAESHRELPVDASLLEVLAIWKQTSQFSAPQDWVFASPVRQGQQPWSYDQVLRSFQKAGAESGIGTLGTHSMRHTYRSWLDAVGTSVAVQQRLMRHADIRTTMNVYGAIVTNEMQLAQSKVVSLALTGAKRIA
jgi:integrase